MENGILRNVRDSVRHWYLLLILGIILVLVGIWVFLTPVESYVALAMLFATAFLVTGIIEIVYAMSNSKRTNNWGWSLVGGIIDFLIGFLLVSHPQITVAILPFFIGFAILFRSIMAIGWSLELRKLRVVDWGNLLAVGILGLIFSFIILWNPLFGGMTIVFYTGLAFIVIGVFQIYLSLKLRKLKSRSA